MPEFPSELSKRTIRSLINNDSPIILDVGCYDGKDGAEIMKPFHSGICYSFECDPRSIDLFHTLQRNNKQLSLQQFALCDKDGEIDFHLSDSDTRRHYDWQESWSASSSIKKPKHHEELFPDVQYKKIIKVPSITLNTWYKNRIGVSPKEIDFIWCDVNGGEEEFIKGGQEVLSKKTKYLYIEFSDKELFEGEITKNQLLYMLPNFDLLGIYNYLGNFGNLLLKNRTL